MPVLFPNAVAMALELMTYGFVAGFVYTLIKKKSIVSIYISLISAMLAGRAVWGVSSAILYGIGQKSYGIAAFFAGAFLEAIPGIILQLVLVPAIIISIEKSRK